MTETWPIAILTHSIPEAIERLIQEGNIDELRRNSARGTFLDGTEFRIFECRTLADTRQMAGQRFSAIREIGRPAHESVKYLQPQVRPER